MCTYIGETWERGSASGPWSLAWLPLRASYSPVQTEVREPVLDDNHHVAHREEEGSNLE